MKTAAVCQFGRYGWIDVHADRRHRGRQQIAGGEIYQALERGSIDAVEWTVPYDDEKLGLSKVAKYYYYPGFWEGTAQLSVLINLKKWEELPAEYKAIIEAAALA